MRDTSSRIGHPRRKDVTVSRSTSDAFPGLPDLRIEYAGALSEEDLAPDWPAQFGRWFAAAIEAGAAGLLPEPNAMVVATADARGRPSARTVLLKGFAAEGFTFFTNYGSRKGAEALANPYASAVFPWYPMHRQVVVVGSVAPVERSVTEAYFATRPRGSQLGAWASPQSTVIPGRAVLDVTWAEVAERYPEGTPVPAPPHWGGFLLTPESVEFWQGRPSRLHDRLRYRRAEEGADQWLVERLAP
jgi:pyridoxamine 5'-phosphate oxidase